MWCYLRQESLAPARKLPETSRRRFRGGGIDSTSALARLASIAFRQQEEASAEAMRARERHEYFSLAGCCFMVYLRREVPPCCAVGHWFGSYPV
jgi:hypothetical protein